MPPIMGVRERPAACPPRRLRHPMIQGHVSDSHVDPAAIQRLCRSGASAAAPLAGSCGLLGSSLPNRRVVARVVVKALHRLDALLIEINEPDGGKRPPTPRRDSNSNLLEREREYGDDRHSADHPNSSHPEVEPSNKWRSAGCEDHAPQQEGRSDSAHLTAQRL